MDAQSIPTVASGDEAKNYRVQARSEGWAKVTALILGLALVGIIRHDLKPVKHPPPAVSTPAPTRQQIFSTLAQATVRIRSTRGGKGYSGSGAFVGSNLFATWILTCAHVVGDTPNVVVDIDAGDTVETAPGRVMYVDKTHDLALVRLLVELEMPTLILAPQEPEQYEELYTVGSPLGIIGMAAIEILSDKHATSPKPGFGKFWEVTGMVQHGQSGSPLVNAQGQIVGVIYAQVNDQLGAVIPLDTVRKFLDGKLK